MLNKIEVSLVDRINGDIVVVAFSDGTSREYKAAMLHGLPENDETRTELEEGGQILPQA